MTEKYQEPILEPVLGDPMAPCHPSLETLELLRLRRSTTAAMMTSPGPDDDQLATLLHLAARVPDHRRVVPYRFVCFKDDARHRAGEILAAVYASNNPDAEEKALAGERERFVRAPVIVAVVASPDLAHKTPEWEQVLCCGAVCQNLLVAASASGFAAQWLSEWYAYDRQVLEAFGLEAHEKIAGFIYLGTASEPPLERPRVAAAEITTHW